MFKYENVIRDITNLKEEINSLKLRKIENKKGFITSNKLMENNNVIDPLIIKLEEMLNYDYLLLENYSTLANDNFLEVVMNNLEKINHQKYYHLSDAKKDLLMGENKETIIFNKDKSYSFFIKENLNPSLKDYPIFKEIGEKIINMRLENNKISDDEIILRLEKNPKHLKLKKN